MNDVDVSLESVSPSFIKDFSLIIHAFAITSTQITSHSPTSPSLPMFASPVLSLGQYTD